MDEFVAMLERASEPAPPDLLNRVLEAISIELADQQPRDLHDSTPTATTLTVRHEQAWDRRRWIVAVAATLVVAATLATLAVLHDRSDAPAVSVRDPGRLPARVELGNTRWTLTWLPPAYEPSHATDNGLTLQAPGQPDISISGQRGERPALAAPLLQLGPLAEAHHDEAAGVLQWNQGGWSFTIDADGVVPRTVLLRLAVGIVPDGDLRAPQLSQTTVQVPDVIGLDYRDATAQLIDAGLRVRWAISSTDSTAVGNVDRTTPSADSTTNAGATVILGVFGVASRTLPSGDALVSGDLPDAVGYYPTWLNEPITPDLSVVDNSQPIVFLHGELVGYGVGDRFETLQQAATNAQRNPGGSTEATVGTSPPTDDLTVPTGPATTSASVGEQVGGPQQTFRLVLPVGFTQRGNSLKQGGGSTFPGHTVDSTTYVDVSAHQMLTVPLNEGCRQQMPSSRPILRRNLWMVFDPKASKCS